MIPPQIFPGLTGASIQKILGLREVPFLPPPIALSHHSYPLEPPEEETWGLNSVSAQAPEEVKAWVSGPP